LVFRGEAGFSACYPGSTGGADTIDKISPAIRWGPQGRSTRPGGGDVAGFPPNRRAREPGFRSRRRSATARCRRARSPIPLPSGRTKTRVGSPDLVRRSARCADRARSPECRRFRRPRHREVAREGSGVVPRIGGARRCQHPLHGALPPHVALFALGGRHLRGEAALCPPSRSGRRGLGIDPSHQPRDDAGRSTFAGKISARNCIVQSLAAIPPSTRTASIVVPASAAIALSRSRVW